ncbi:MAG: RES family NAD+ phosphorylase, partial [Gemmatimonadaceae bacterium]
MVASWRIVKSRFAATAFDGEGARRNGGRWTSVGRRAVYTSSTIALATLEMVAHLDSTGPLGAYSLFEAGIPESTIKSIDSGALPANWMEYPAPSELTKTGDTWLEEKEFAVLKVPSAVVGLEFNYLLNPLHR